MMALSEIIRLNKEATEKSRKRAALPWEPTGSQRTAMREHGKLLAEVKARVPFLGDYVPKGWRREGEALFVDMTGIGLSSEPAMTQKALSLEIGNDPPRTGYGLIEHGQFQAYLAKYRKL